MQALACIIGTARLFSFSDMFSIIRCQCQNFKVKSSATLKALSLATALIYLHDCMNLSGETCLVSGYEASQPFSFRSIGKLFRHRMKYKQSEQFACILRQVFKGIGRSGIASFSLYQHNGLFAFVFKHVSNN